MAVRDTIDITGAGSVQEVAQTIATGLAVIAEDCGTPETPAWHIAVGDWLVLVRATPEIEAHEAPINVTDYHVGPDTAPLRDLTECIY